MTRILTALLLATLSFAASADIYQAQYGVAKVFPFWLYNADGTLDVDEVDGGTEVALSCNQGAETTATNDFVDEGTHYSISLTAAELQCQTVVVVVNATVVGGFVIQTHGHASAFDVADGWETGDSFARIGAAGAGLTNIDLPNQTMDITGTLSTVTTVTNTVTANTTQISGDSVVADRLEAMLDGTCGSYPELGVTRGVGCTAQAYTAGTPSLTLDTSAAFGDNTLTNATILICGSTQGYCQPAVAASNVESTDVVTLRAALPVAATGTITYTIFGTATASGDVNVTTIEGMDATTVLGTAQTGDAFARLGAPAGASVSADILTLGNFVDDLESRLGTPSNLGGGATIAFNLSDIEAQTDDIGTAGAGLTNIDLPNQTMNITGTLSGSVGSVVNLEQAALADAAVVNCTVNTANFAGSTTTVACILTDRDAGAITAASGDLEGRELLILSGAQIYEGRFINDTTWDGANSELQLTLSRALPGTLADAVTAIIR